MHEQRWAQILLGFVNFPCTFKVMFNPWCCLPVLLSVASGSLLHESSEESTPLEIIEGGSSLVITEDGFSVDDVIEEHSSLDDVIM